jgi:putative copper export protein/methionine-rich copper-binding protein CopC
VSKTRLLLLVITLLLWTGTLLPAQAHGYIVRAIPANRAVLERPPTRLQFWFSESLEPRFSELLLRDAAGQVLAAGGVDARNPTLLTLQVPPGTLGEGAYIVELRPAFASDGHVTAESSLFYVGDEVAGVDALARDDRARPLEVLWKALLLCGTSLLFGTALLYDRVLWPAWGSAAYPAGGLPPRVMQRLNRSLWTGLGLALVASLLALLQQTMVFFNVDALTVLRDGLWQIVRSGSRTGDVWTARLLFLLLLLALFVFSQRYGRTTPALIRPAWAAAVWLIALIIGTQAVISHAAGSPVLPWLALLMHWGHTLAVAFWVGGVVALALVLPVALQPYQGAARQAALLAVMQRFSRLMTLLVALVITTGMYNATNWFFTPADVVSGYGAALGLKLLLVALLLAVAALHHVALRPALAARLERFLSQRLIVRAGQFGGLLRLEAVFASLTLALAALLSATPIPQPATFAAQLPALTGTQTVAGLAVSITLSPGAPGINTLDVVLSQDGQPVTAPVEVQWASPAQDSRTRWLPADPVAGGLYTLAADAINTPGTWWLLVDVNPGDPAGFRRAFFALEIAPEAAVLSSRPPSLPALAALALVVLAAIRLLRPLLRWLAARLNLHPASLLIGGGAIAISVALLAVAVIGVQQEQVRFQQALRPPPARLNPVPPDAASLARGEALYQAHCLIWQTARDFQPLLRSLDTLRDEDLYALPAAGWRSVPPCTRPLTEAQTWDVVNFLRTRRVLLVQR